MLGVGGGGQIAQTLNEHVISPKYIGLAQNKVFQMCFMKTIKLF